MHRVPTEIKKLRGSYRTTPEKKFEPMPTAAIGLAPKYFNQDERDCWNEIKRIIPENVLFESDRLCIEMASRILAKFRRREDLSPSEWNKLASCISLMGMTPADRTRICAAPSENKKDPNPFDAVMAIH